MARGFIHIFGSGEFMKKTFEKPDFINGNLDEMNSILKKELTLMLLASPGDRQPIKKFVFEFISSIITESITLGIDVEMISQYTDVYSRIFAFEDNHLLLQYISKFTESLYAEFTKLGAYIEIADDFMIVHGGKLHGGMCSSHNDHRIAMALITASLNIDGEVYVDNLHCISKSFPNFIQNFR